MKKTITIYATTVEVPENVTILDIQKVKDFSELLDNNITDLRKKELLDLCQACNLNVIYENYPDGRIGQKLVGKDALKTILEAVSSVNGECARYFNMPSPELPGINVEDFNQILPLIKAAQRFGIPMEIKTCSNEDFKTMSVEEAERISKAIEANSGFTIKLHVD